MRFGLSEIRRKTAQLERALLRCALSRSFSPETQAAALNSGSRHAQTHQVEHLGVRDAQKDGFGTPRGNAQGDFFNGLSLAPGDGREVEAS